MVDVKQVADAADMIVNGYAFTRCTEGFRVLNLNRPDRAVVFSNDGKSTNSLRGFQRARKSIFRILIHLT